MAQSFFPNDLIEGRFFPMVEHVKGFFGFGLDDQNTKQCVTPPSDPMSKSPLNSSGDPPLSRSPFNSKLATTRTPREGSPAASSASSAATNNQRSPFPSSNSVAGGLRNCSPAPENVTKSNNAVPNHVLPTRTGSYHNDLCRSKGALSDSPNRGYSLDVATKGHSDSNHSRGIGNDVNAINTTSPYRQILPSFGGGGGGGDFEASLTVCPEEQLVDLLDEPDYSSTGEKLGRLQFSVSYDFDAMTLTVKIMKAEELAAKDLSGTSDPYVKICLLPDKKHTLTTNIKRKNLNPRWNEVFAFEGFPYNKVLTKTLYLLVIDYDRFSRDDPIGEVCIPLSDIDLAAGATMWKTLQPCKGSVVRP